MELIYDDFDPAEKVGNTAVDSEPVEIRFWAAEGDYNDYPPAPAQGFVPEWYRQRPKYQSGNSTSDLKVQNNDNADSATISMKHCMPFLDIMTAGYMYVLPKDIQVTTKDGRPKITWLDDGLPDPLDFRGHIEMPVPPGCWPVHFIWEFRWLPATPRGYSVMVTHPFNRYDLPFVSMSAIVDSDNWSSQGVVPFFLRTDFQGIIKAGTPIFQIIPFKRETYASRFPEGTELANMRRAGYLDLERKRTNIYGFYKKLRWTKKSYK